MQQRGSYGGRPGQGSSGPNRQSSPSTSTNQHRLVKRLQNKDSVTYFKPPVRNNEKPAPRPELFDQEAEAIARKLASVPASQLRRFFGAVKTIKRQLELDRRS